MGTFVIQGEFGSLR